MSRKQFAKLLLIILTVVCVASSTITGVLSFSIKRVANDYMETFTETRYYKIYDNLVGDAEKSFFSSPSAIEKVRCFCNGLKTSEEFEYLEMNTQSIYIGDFEGNIASIYQSNTGEYDQTYEKNLTLSNGVTGCFSEVKAIWVSGNVFDCFRIDITGRKFLDEEFTYSKGDRIPIILGNKYRDYFDVGEIFPAHFIFFDGEAEIIGFMAEDANIWYGNKFLNLDDYFVVPMLDDMSEIQNDDDQFRQTAIYLMKMNGIIATDQLSAEEVQTQVTSLCEDYGIIPASYVDGAKNAPSYIFGISIDQIAEKTLFIAKYSLVLTIVVLCAFMAIQARKKETLFNFDHE